MSTAFDLSRLLDVLSEISDGDMEAEQQQIDHDIRYHKEKIDELRGRKLMLARMQRLVKAETGVTEYNIGVGEKMLQLINSDPERIWKIDDLCESLGISGSSASGAAKRLADKRRIRRLSRGHYQSTRAGRSH